jgi:hypothetical protein
MVAQRVALLTGLWLVLLTAPFAGAEPQRQASRQPMIFFLAKGGPDSCGPGCSEWIAAEGVFGPDTLGRLTAFLHALERTDLPIFFHSPGGSLQAAMAVGYKLRGWRIAAGVGRSVVEGCKDSSPRDQDCLALIQSGEPVNAKLRFDRASCASACVTALIGAPKRTISDQARLGIHSPNYGRNRQWGVDTSAVEERSRARTMDSLRHFAVTMGVEASLIDESEKTPHNKVHWLSRDEMIRFGILAGDSFETAWWLIDGPTLTIVKSLTRSAPRTTVLKIACHGGDKVRILVRRELPEEELGVVSEIRLVARGDVVARSRDLNDQRDDERRLVVAAAALRAAAANGLVLDESVATADGALTRSAPIATAGLAEALDRLLQGCAAARPARPVPKPRRLRFAGAAATLAPLWFAPYMVRIPAAAGTLLR